MKRIISLLLLCSLNTTLFTGLTNSKPLFKEPLRFENNNEVSKNVEKYQDLTEKNNWPAMGFWPC